MDFNKNAIDSTFGEYAKKYLVESIDVENEVELFEVSEMVNHILDSMKNGDVAVNCQAKINHNQIIELGNINVDIEFKLNYIDENQHIKITYTPDGDIEPISLSEIPESEYDIVSEDTIIFNSVDGLSNNIFDIKFKQLIEWPCDMELDNVTAQKKLDKAKTLAAKLELLLGKDELINKVKGFKSLHQTTSNQNTRTQKAEKREEEAIRTAVTNNQGKTKSQILYDMILQVAGVTDIRIFDATGKYYKRFVIRYGKDVQPLEVLFNSTGYFCRVFGQSFTGVEYKSREEVIKWIESHIAKNDMLTLSPREKMQRKYNLSKNTETTISGTYNKFIADAEAFLSGESELTKEDLLDTYDILMDHEAKLTDTQMNKLGELYDSLGLENL